MHPELKRCLAPCRTAFLAVGFLSGITNLLALTGSIFMLVVYDRVIPSGSVPTLVVLALCVAALYGLLAFVEILRSRILTRIGIVIREKMTARSLEILIQATRSEGTAAGGVVRDVDRLSAFFSSTGLVALLDLPWIPLYVAICFGFHFDIGACVAIGALALVVLTVLGEFATKHLSHALEKAGSTRRGLVNSMQANVDGILAMGMAPALLPRWALRSRDIDVLQRKLSDRTAALSTITRSVRMALQSLVLAVGAYLVMRQEATGGVMIASSILSARALAPVELAIGQWKSMLTARIAWKDLRKRCDAVPADGIGLTLPKPRHVLSIDNLTVRTTGSARPVLDGVTFALKAGDALAVIGPTGSGKSTLARALVALDGQAGTVRLDGMPIERWRAEDRGRFVGYLPQASNLLQGTIAENIARFDPAATMTSVLEATRAAGLSELVAQLPMGYQTRIGSFVPSGGQMQRLCLARALYGNPFLLVLDEPNSSLDRDGDIALNSAILAARRRNAIVVVIAHRPGVLAVVSHVAVLEAGRLKAFGQADDVIKDRAVPSRSATSSMTARVP